MESAAEILREGRIKIGPSATQGRPGIYCERTARKACVTPYAVHTMPFDDDGFLSCTILELAVDRNMGHSAHQQWIQPEESILITGMYTHLINITSVFDSGYLGWFRIHDTVCDDSASLNTMMSKVKARPTS